MTEKKPGITFSETMSGPFALGESDPSAGETAGKKAGTTLSMHASVEIPDLDRFVTDPSHTGRITGHIDFPPFGQGMRAERGVFRLFSPTGQPGLTRMIYELAFDHKGQPYYLAGHKDVRSDRHGTDLWNDTTTLLTRLHSGDAHGPVVGSGVLRLGVPELVLLTTTIRVTNAAGPADQVRTLASFGRFFMGNLWDTYGPKGHL